MDNKKIPITHQINKKALELIKNSPEGVRWSELKTRLEEIFPDFHPKTINGCVWKLIERYPDQVYKPEKGLFKYKNLQ